MVAKPLFLLAAVLIALAAYVRLAPSDPARWHRTPDPVAKRFGAGLVEVLPGDASAFQRLDAIIRATQRTLVLAGRPEDGLVTYVTRSRLWGFPDYTTIHLTGDGRIVLYSRLQFGRSDGGVNAARAANWLDRLQAVQ